MKIILLLTLGLFSLETIASDIYCVNPDETNLFYMLKRKDYDSYDLIVTKQILDPISCGSRWGCDYENKIIYRDILEYNDVQGASVFESKRTYIEMEDMDDAYYRYTIKNKSGVFIQRTAKLKCQLN